ncbi:MAG: DNA ligase D, partial [Lachnospiraceae bacterium]|nr:DNA ligase D [Lachnospiraceae bacterium]
LINFAAGRAMVLDGEMVIIDKDGRTDFGALQSYLKNPQGKNLTYIIFDLLALDGKDLRALPLIRRKEMLEKLLKGAPPNIHYSRHVINAGEESMAIAEKMNMEGIIGKKAESLYSGLRNGDWIKLKCDKRQEFVIGGFTVSDKSASGLSSLLLGAYEEDELTYIGRAGTGFTENSAKEILAKFKKLIRKISPFKEPPKARANEGITWLKPTMMAEIKFAEWTKDHKLRQASFKGLRDDKDAKEVKLEIAENIEAEEEKIKKNTGVTKSKKAGNDTDVTVQSIKITNPAKVLYDEPVITKIDVIRYYEQVAEVMLPYISERIISAVRCPKGVSGTCFFKKHPEANRQGIKTFGDYFYIDDIVGLISEAQMGTLEFHTWGSQVSEIENPDIIVFDLDPDEGMELKTIRRGVRDIRSVLNDLSLNSYLKTSGGKGYHIVVPLKPTASWEVVRDFCKSVVDVMEKKWPDRYTSNSRKVNRKGKIFIDWLRNTRGATSIAPYSLRARQGAKVSMPISWDELSKIAPDGIDMYTALRRIKTKDPWHDFFRNEQGLR